MSIRGDHDAVIVGGGHNGLVSAAYLARAGLKVLVLERRHLVGGAAVTQEVFPGFRYSVASYVVSLLRPEIIRDLRLPEHGLDILPLESTLTPLPGGDSLARWSDPDQTRREIARWSPRDADAYADFSRCMYKLAWALKPLLSTVPPNPLRPGVRDAKTIRELARAVRGLDEADFERLFKLTTMSAADFLSEWFETGPLIATMSASGIIGTFAGPRTPGTAYVLLHHYLGEIDGVFRAWGFARGGNGAVSESIASAARSLGAEIRTSAPVEQVITSGGRARGVVLEGGEEIGARVVLSGLDPKRTFLQLLDQSDLPGEFVKSIQRFRIRGSSGKVNLALSELPRFTCLAGAGGSLTRTPGEAETLLRGAISISPSVDYLERAYDDAKYGRFSRRPFMDIVIPSMIDPTMAPPGKHVMSVFVQYAPFALDGGWNRVKRDAFGDAVIDTLAEFAPGLRDIILHRQVMTPLDMQQQMGLTEGNIFHGELTLQQLFLFRPVTGWANFRTPVRGYYQCGSGAHPGGGVCGAPGRLAALEVLRDLKVRRGRS
ncbi:MAG: NAD(P)/FAD-dependent oxidoreductase [Gemmatimonadetes bacterium]|nr:NAD(P)/FAD-dependent oxidoreductase [Gemmatimonadota bacterium]